MHAVGVLGQQRHVGERATAGDIVLAALRPANAGAFAAVSVRREVSLHADERRHAHLGGGFEEVFQASGAVEHRVLGVHMQMDEGVGLSVIGRHPRRHSALILRSGGAHRSGWPAKFILASRADNQMQRDSDAPTSLESTFRLRGVSAMGQTA